MTPAVTSAMIEEGYAQQRIAADPAHSAWVSANAGTGKTTVLVNRIARILLAGTPPSKVLCLTFTKAAAAEMANRLNGRLGGWAVIDDVALDADLLQLLGRAPNDADRATARRLFADVLDVPGGLKIRTIHSFCESMLGQFPLEAGIAPHFAVADDRTKATVMERARDTVLAGGAPGLAETLRTLAALTDADGFARVVGELATRRHRLAAMLKLHGGVEGLIAAARRHLGLADGDSEKSLLEAACVDAAFDGEGLHRACAALDNGTAKNQATAALIRAWLADAPSRADGLRGDYRDVFLKKDGDPRKDSTLMTKGALQSDPGALDILLAEQTRIVALADRLRAVRTVDATAAAARLGTALLEVYGRDKEDRALLDYDDLILAARDLLSEERGVAWVHFKLDGGIDHILVDEAQDTSPEQWDVVRGLAGEFFSGRGAREGGRTMFAVGDEKQSIYSFQGAAPEAFHAMGEHFKAGATAAEEPFQGVEMPLCFRSTPTVLGAVDAVFAREEARAGLTFGGALLRHIPKRAGQAGLIEIWPTIAPGEREDADPWDAPLDHVAESDPMAQLAARIADTIRGWLDTGEILESAARPVEPGDIMILVRRRKPFAEVMVKALKDRGVPVAGSDRMILTEQIAVMDLLALARFVLLPEDDLSLAELLKSPLFGLDDDDLFRLCHGRDGTLWAALRADKAYADTVARLSDLRDKADFVPPFEFFAEVLGPGRGREKLLERLGPDAADPLDEFLNLALAFEREHAPSLQEFLYWVAASDTEIKRDLEMGRGEVRVLTVHGAKGLQAGIVFLPDTCRAPDARTESSLLWIGGEDPAFLWPALRANEETLCRSLREDARRAQEDEYRRLLYVAMTRACDRLYVCGWETKHGRSAGCWYDLIHDALAPMAVDLGEGALRVAEAQTEPPDGPQDDARVVQAAEPLPAWARAAPPEEPDPPRPLTPSRPEGDDPPVRSPLGADGIGRFRRGRLIHRLLQSLPESLPAQWGAAARAFLARPANELSVEEVEAIAAETLAVIGDARFADLFGPESRAEVALVGSVGGRVVSGQVDRLVVGTDAVTVVDYKTNRPPPKRIEDVSSVYLAQMAAYRALLRGVFPDRPVRCVLLWTDGPSAMVLPDGLMDRHAP